MGSSTDLMLICLLCFLLWEGEARTVEFRVLKSNDKKQSAAPEPKGTSPSSAPKPKGTSPSSAPEPQATSPSSASGPGGTVFDVTKHGAISDGKTDNSKAFLAAWAAACKSSAQSTLLVPKGDFLVGTVAFVGPCSKSPHVEISGKLIAPPASGSDGAWITFRGLSGLNISGAGGSLNGQGEKSWATSCVHSANSNCKMAQTSLQLSSITGGSLSGITSINSKAFHMVVSQCSDFTIRDVKIQAPVRSRNTDGVHIGDSSGITVTDSEIGTGDDCVSIGAGTSNIAVTNVKCGPGHGISLGSLGRYPGEKTVNGLKVTGCTLTGTDNGVRIKTWPASEANTVSNVIFEDITMTDVKNPIIVTQQYCDKAQCDSKPSRVKLTDIKFRNIKGTTPTKEAVSISCSEAVPCEGVELAGISLKSTAGDVTSICKNAKGVASGVQSPTSCFKV